MKIPLRRYIELLRVYLRPQLGRVILLAALLLGGIALQLANPLILRGFIDAATQRAEPGPLTAAALLFIGFALLGQLLAVGVTYVSEQVAWTSTNALRADLAAHCLRLDMAFHKTRSPGEMIERVDGDVNELSLFFSNFVVQLLGNLLLLVGVLVMLLRENWLIGVAMGLFALGALNLLLRLRNLATPLWARVRDQSAQFYGFVGEQLAGTEDVRSSGATGYVMGRFYTLLRAWLPISRRASLAGYSMWATTLGLFTVGNALAFGLSAYLWGQGAITIGTVYLIFFYTELLRQPIDQLRTQLQDLQKADASIGRVATLFATQPAVQDGIGSPLPDGPLAVELRDVSFAYDDGEQGLGARGQGSGAEEQRSGAEPNSPAPQRGEPQRRERDTVLRDLSFTIPAGRVLGILGRTGSGKTTLARLLLRLYDPTAGEVRLGGVPLREAKIADLRRRVGVVTQDVQLFNASVRDNLSFFDPTVDDKRICAVLNELGLEPWLRGLPHGLDSELEGNAALSAGEAQLLAFARLFLIDPGLVILDEASSRLDPATEQLIERAVRRLLAGRTGIIIAHRLATVQRADEILILERGGIVERGERQALADDLDSRFAQLLRTGMEEVLT
ncbi:MAG: ABC transporter ATP-binding protein [Roseiflexaceae bacterium]|nr:ABC transporter ATP-binding protein [Roseiflexaceae bacterium]